MDQSTIMVNGKGDPSLEKSSSPPLLPDTIASVDLKEGIRPNDVDGILGDIDKLMNESSIKSTVPNNPANDTEGGGKESSNSEQTNPNPSVLLGKSTDSQDLQLLNPVLNGQSSDSLTNPNGCEEETSESQTVAPSTTSTPSVVSQLHVSVTEPIGDNVISNGCSVQDPDQASTDDQHGSEQSKNDINTCDKSESENKCESSVMKAQPFNKQEATAVTSSPSPIPPSLSQQEDNSQRPVPSPSNSESAENEPSRPTSSASPTEDASSISGLPSPESNLFNNDIPKSKDINLDSTAEAQCNSDSKLESDLVGISESCAKQQVPGTEVDTLNHERQSEENNLVPQTTVSPSPAVSHNEKRSSLIISAVPDADDKQKCEATDGSLTERKTETEALILVCNDSKPSVLIGKTLTPPQDDLNKPKDSSDCTLRVVDTDLVSNSMDHTRDSGVQNVVSKNSSVDGDVNLVMETSNCRGTNDLQCETESVVHMVVDKNVSNKDSSDKPVCDIQTVKSSCTQGLESSLVLEVSDSTDKDSKSDESNELHKTSVSSESIQDKTSTKSKDSLCETNNSEVIQMEVDTNVNNKDSLDNPVCDIQTVKSSCAQGLESGLVAEVSDSGDQKSTSDEISDLHKMSVSSEPIQEKTSTHDNEGKSDDSSDLHKMSVSSEPIQEKTSTNDNEGKCDDNGDLHKMSVLSEPIQEKTSTNNSEGLSRTNVQNSTSKTVDEEKKETTDVCTADDSVILLNEDTESDSSKENTIDSDTQLSKKHDNEPKTPEDTSTVDINVSKEESSNDTKTVTPAASEARKDPENQRKRGLRSTEEGTDSMLPKRTKLDETIARVASDVPTESEAMEVVDSDDDIIFADEQTDVKTDDKKQVDKELGGVLSVSKVEKDGKDVKSSVLQTIPDEVTKLDCSSINLTSQVLQCFIDARIKAFCKKQRQQLVEKLNKRLTSMQSSTSLWKETTKHLEKSVKDVTTVKDNLAKRRERVKKLSNQSVGVQVNTATTEKPGRDINHSPFLNNGQGPQQMAALPLVRPPSQQTNLQQKQWANSQVPVPHGISPRLMRPPVAAPRPPADVADVVDLTDDDDPKRPGGQQSLPASTAAARSPGNNRSGVMGNGHIGNIMNSSPARGAQQQRSSSNAGLPTSPSSQNSAIAGALARPVQTSPVGSAPPLTMHTLPPSLFIQGAARHPAPLPSSTSETSVPSVTRLKLPPKPTLMISRVSQGIVLSWNMPPLNGVEVIISYQLFAYQETDTAPKTSSWKKVGDVKALPLPMACTLTQFLEGNRYHFAVRAVDKHQRTGPFSDPSSIFLGSTKK